MKTFLLLFFLPLFAQAHLTQILDIQLTPALKSLVVQDRIITKEVPPRTNKFRLNKNLAVTLLSEGDRLRPLSTSPLQAYTDYELDLGADGEALLEYTGVIFDAVVDNDSSGLISAEGAVLFGSTYWLPSFSEFGSSEYSSYEITRLRMPSDWILASPRAQSLPQPEIYLVAGPFKKIPMAASDSSLPFAVYLRSEDPALAQSLLAPLPAALAHFEKTIGPFPYSSFSIIENFWETGFGMPGFTLLGPGVIRLPYILNSSLPHELLHNWWGNSVFVDPERGNWSEGLTTFMSDYAFLGEDQARREYRHNILMAYQDYTKTSGDFPLRQFKGRHNSSSQAIGYGKGLMFFSMLEQKLSPSVFESGLRDFYSQNLGRAVSFEELQLSFEKASGQNLGVYFTQWLDQKGAPQIKILKAHREAQSSRQSKVHLQLAQSEPPYDLLIPLKWTFADGTTKSQQVRFHQKNQDFYFQWEQPPRKLEVDPDFEVFRNLDSEERPATLSRVFGSSPVRITAVDPILREAYHKAWQRSLEGPVLEVNDQILQEPPAKGAVVLIGESALYESFMKDLLKDQAFSTSKTDIHILGQVFDRAGTTSIVTAKGSSGSEAVYIWIRGTKDLSSFAPRLLHYGKYGVLVFEEKKNLLKMQWPLLSSPLKVEWPTLD